jgi:hypothetical protein
MRAVRPVSHRTSISCGRCGGGTDASEDRPAEAFGRESTSLPREPLCVLQVLTEGSKLVHAPLDFRQMCGTDSGHALARFPTRAAQAQDLAGLGQGQAQTLRATDEPRFIKDPICIEPISGAGPCRAGNEFLILVEPDRMGRDARPLGRFPGWRGVLTDGVSTGRLQLCGWLLAEDRRTPYDGSDRTPNPLQERTRVRVWLLAGDIRLTKAFGVQVTATVPDVTRSAVVERPASTVNFSETFKGTGDTSVVAWHRSVTFGWHFTVNGGVSLPTGKTERPRFRAELEDGSLVPTSRLQRGTGTFDPVQAEIKVPLYRDPD